jgi:hypothetical protein
MGDNMIKKPDWKYQATVTKIIKVEDKNEELREIDAIDLEMAMPFILDVIEDVELESVQVGRNYRATIKVYRAKLTPEIEKSFAKMSREDPTFREGEKFIRRYGGQQPLFKFELVSLEEI